MRESGVSGDELSKMRLAFFAVCNNAPMGLCRLACSWLDVPVRTLYLTSEL
jgi:hypothetical protein